MLTSSNRTEMSNLAPCTHEEADTRLMIPDLTPVLCALKASPEIITEESLAVLERFVVLLYDRTSSLLKVNEARQELFCKKSREFDRIPPTKAALEQHIRRAVLQGAHTWGQTLLCQPALPSPADWGWQRQASRWSPYWTTLKVHLTPKPFFR